MSVKWYTILALCFTCLDVCYPACSQENCYSPDIQTAYRPLAESVLQCTRSGGCVCNLCFERNSVVGEPRHCVVASGCWHFVDYNSTHQTCRRNVEGEAFLSQTGASTGVILGGFVLCIAVGISLCCLWRECAKKNKAFFVRHKRFAIRFMTVYFTSLAIFLFVCGTGIGITLAVLDGQYCIRQRSDDDDDNFDSDVDDF